MALSPIVLSTADGIPPRVCCHSPVAPGRAKPREDGRCRIQCLPFRLVSRLSVTDQRKAPKPGTEPTGRPREHCGYELVSGAFPALSWNPKFQTAPTASIFAAPARDRR